MGCIKSKDEAPLYVEAGLEKEGHPLLAPPPAYAIEGADSPIEGWFKHGVAMWIAMSTMPATTGKLGGDYVSLHHDGDHGNTFRLESIGKTLRICDVRQCVSDPGKALICNRFGISEAEHGQLVLIISSFLART